MPVLTERCSVRLFSRVLQIASRMLELARQGTAPHAFYDVRPYSIQPT